jgi:transglutaminase-like putative cysteine protease
MSSTWRSESYMPETPAVDDGTPLELEVLHETVYRYASPVELAHHLAFLRPRDEAPQQRLLAFDLAIEPRPAHLRSELDAFGNTRCLFSLIAAHEALRVRAASRVRVAPTAVGGAPAWEAARERWRYVSGRPLDAAAPFVFASPLVPRHEALRAYAEPSFPPGRALDAAALDLMQRLHDDFEYEPESTEVGTPLMDAFEQRAGVCQDFAHLMIGCLRSLGLAARYVSGYLLTEPPPGQPRLQGADASHAWAAVALPAADGTTRWLELDPTNACVAGRSHLRLAVGRDYGDVTPLRGVIRGGARHELEVRVHTRAV